MAPVGLAAISAALGATLLPFWPPVLVAAIVLAAGAAAWFNPRIALLIALAAPVFPLGNHAAGAAVLFGVFAVGWLVLGWRDARSSLLFACGPLLGPLGLLTLVPLCVQPARGAVRRAAQAALAVLSAALLAGIAGGKAPLDGEPFTPLRITPLDSPGEIGLAVWQALSLHPVLLAGVAAASVAAGVLPWARKRFRHGVAALGTALLAGSIVTGSGILAVLVIALVWAIASAVASGTRR